MLFNSYVFLLLFLPLTLAVYVTLGRLRWRWAMGWLVLVSLGFYAWWSPDPSEAWTPFYLILILASCAGNFWCGRSIAHTSSPRRRFALLSLGVGANLALLAYYKYLGLFATLLNGATGWPHEIPHLVLPLAVSFFTFLQVAYLVDAHRGITKDYNFNDYLLFVTFFPHLIAGPLVHHTELMPQFNAQAARPGRRQFAVGLTLLAVGLFKKVVIADYVARTATPLFDFAASGARPLLFGEAWAAALGYTMQIYFDFSGYSDMAIGIAYFFGIRLPLNFNSPYKATSIVDFWRRWHITLSRFLREYLYFPLGGNRRGPARRYSNLLVTMVLGGLWHGAGVTFFLWGLLHGVYLCVNHGWAAIRERAGWGPLPRGVAIPLTFLAVVMAWVPFRAGSYELSANGSAEAAWKTTHGIYASMVGLNGWESWPAKGAEIVKSSRAWRPLIAAMLIAWLLPNSQRWLGRYSPHYGPAVIAPTERRRMWQWRPTWPWMLLVLGLLYAVGREFNKLSEFIYFQF
ncbi:MBOAT family O-acyltransferase [Rariglobus hedericola]|uniref:MBOAT family protein n=1 Tax=Rariglobus hedericola TaxID=2597822 RepID=A0A556QNY3_9BACT|nr:MBOAT family protein [Rariglobus hedericola]TSJ78327.1 MBOAT family protein [Rariglobus hedericola]